MTEKSKKGIVVANAPQTDLSISKLSNILQDQNAEVKQAQEDKINEIFKQLLESKTKTLEVEAYSHLKQYLSNDLSQAIPEPKYLLLQGNIGTLPVGDIQAVKGLAKAGKSYFVSILIASILGCEKFGFRCTEPNAKVIYFDTEQNRPNTTRLIRRVHSLLDWDASKNNDRLLNFSLRSRTREERRAFIDLVTRMEKPTAIFIDGIADLLEDFNDPKESQDIILELMRLSAECQCAVVNVLHTARTSTTGSMKGHLGSLLLQKVSDEYEVKKSADNVFSVSQSDTRNSNILDFSFVIDPTTALPINNTEIANERIAQAKALEERNKAEKLKSFMQEVFGAKQNLRFADMVKDDVLLRMNVSKRTMVNKIKTAESTGLLFHDQEFQYYKLLK